MRITWFVAAVMVYIGCGFPLAGQSMLSSQIAAVDQPVVPVQARMMARVSLHLENVTLERALRDLEYQAGVQFVYSKARIPVHRIVSVKGTDMTLDAALAQLLAGTQVVMQRSAQGQIILAPRSERKQSLSQGTIVGKVVHAKTRQPVEGARVTVGDPEERATTKADGTFRIPAATGEQRVQVRAVGFERQSVKVTVTSDVSTTVEIALVPAASVLDEVIVTGTVVETERKAIPNPITVFTAKDLEQRGITRLEELFHGAVPGVVALEQGSAVYSRDQLGGMETSQVYARGSSYFRRDGTSAGAPTPNPLKTYIDGVEILDPSYLGTIDPKTIDRIEIIVGPQAATVYGSGAMGGVMQIFTKKGFGGNTTDVSVAVKYGMLENNLSNGRTPSHEDLLSASGGSGPAFSYAATLSYGYTGQWRPSLFRRTVGSSVGITYSRSGVTVNGSASLVNGANGTVGSAQQSSPLRTAMMASGELRRYVDYGAVTSQLKSSSRSRTLSLSADYRLFSIWQHHISGGISETDFMQEPRGPRFVQPFDTLFEHASSSGHRTSYGYNTTFILPVVQRLSSTMTLGVTGSTGDETRITRACTATSSVTSYIACTGIDGRGVDVSRTLDDRSTGGFGRWQLGILDQLYLTAGVRAEKNPAYGDRHRIDWTPSYGVAYTVSAGDVSMKLQGSYGRATRRPTVSLVDQTCRYPGSIPSEWLCQAANPLLRPERSHGPQGGIEVYYGNVGSLSINHFVQKVVDLTSFVIIDSTYISVPEWSYQGYEGIWQAANVASIRQYGWEGEAMLNLGLFRITGTYSWSESRMGDVPAMYQPAYHKGLSFIGVPSHTGQVMIAYANKGTSLAMTMNYVGSSMQELRNTAAAGLLLWSVLEGRLEMYNERRWGIEGYTKRPGYVKTNLSGSQRLTSWATLTLNVTNLGNSYGSESSFFYPAIGRQTLLGVSLRRVLGDR